MTNIKRYGRDQVLIPTIYDEKITRAQFMKYDTIARCTLFILGSLTFCMTTNYYLNTYSQLDTTRTLAVCTIVVISIGAIFNRILL